MRFGKAAGLTAGFLGVFAAGVAVGPSLTQRAEQNAAVPQVHVSEPSNTAPVAAAQPAPRPVRAPSTFRVSKEVVIVAPPTHPELYDRLKPVLNRGADLNKAADGFRNGEEFAAVAHAARNTRVPFMLLKQRVLHENMSLDEAIRASNPDADARSEAARARTEAKSDLSAINL